MIPPNQSAQSSHLDVKSELDLDRALMLAMMSDVRAGLPHYETKRVDEWPSLTTITVPVWLGSFAWTATNDHWRIVQKSNIHAVYGGVALTPADIARDYIRAKYKKAGRITTGQYEATVKDHRCAPLYSKVGVYEDCAYVDLKSAYWSIVQVVGWDVDYHPNRFLGVRSNCRDFPFYKIKLARNCLVSCGLIGAIKRWDGTKLTFLNKRNPLVNLVLYALVQDVLHSVASDMIERAGAVYVHTDGYLVPRNRVHDAFGVLSEWGFVGSIKNEGQTTVYGIGTYACGSKENNRATSRMGKDFTNIRSEFASFLRPRFAKFSSRFPLILA